MDKLPSEKRAEITRMSTERLKGKLVATGLGVEEVGGWDRETVMEVYADLVAEELQKGHLEGGTRADANVVAGGSGDVEVMKPISIWERELALREMEFKFRLEERERAEKERAAERDLRLLEMERAEKYRAEEREVRKMEYERLARLDKLKESEGESIIGRTRKYAEAIKNVFPNMPNESAELPSYFDAVENLFKIYAVPNDLKAKLLLPRLTGRAKSLVSKLSVAELDQYESIRNCLLTEFRLTPRELRARFVQAAKKSDESYTLFASRLENLFTYYLRSRGADKDVKKMFDLLVADKLKDCLSASTLQYVLSLEGDACFTPSKIASSADIYASNYDEGGVYRGHQFSNLRTDGSSVTAANIFAKPAIVSKGNKPGRPHYVKEKASEAKSTTTSTPFIKRCFRCKSDQHFIASCPHKTQAETGKAVHAKSCVVAVAEGALTETGGNVKPPEGGEGDQAKIETGRVQDRVALVSSACKSERNAMLQICPLQYIDVCINNDRYKALVDSGCEVPLVHSRVFKNNEFSSIGNVWLQPIVGCPVKAKLASLDVCKYPEDAAEPNDREAVRPVHIVFAVTNDLVGHDVVLPVNVVEKLQCSYHTGVVQPCVTVAELMVAESGDETEGNRLPVDNSLYSGLVDADAVSGVVSVNGDNIATASEGATESPGCTRVAGDDGDCQSCDSDVQNEDRRLCEEALLTDGTAADLDNSSRSLLIEEQRNDTTLSGCRKLADRGKGNFLYRGGVLYHIDHVVGQRVEQMVLPKTRRLDVLSLAHDKCGLHLGQRKTNERIRYSFFWPELRNDVIQFCNSCVPCQRKSRLLAKDRVPINYIPRNSLVPGEHLIMDTIGPIDPPSAAGHKYLLCIVDVCTRWPAVYLLKNLSAKAVCDSLLELFATIGVASIISSDNASNFTSQLTREFLNRMGCSPVFASPRHPEAQGLVERFNQSCKKALHHVIHENARQWHRCIPFIVWSLRESSNETTSVPPYTLMFGRVPRGPLAILKETWVGERELPSTFTRSEVQYMTELKHNLEIAQNYANEHAIQGQERYVNQYNRHTRNKAFQLGDQVILLEPDSSNKLLSRWRTGVVAKVKSPYSYLVNTPDGASRHVHVNKLRPLVVRAQSVIHESDTEFGRILTVPTDSDRPEVMLPSKNIDMSKIAHLTEDQRTQILALLDEFAVCFSDKPGLCDVAEHDIVTTAGFVPKRAKAYKIPDALKPEVDRQIGELLKDGFLKPSTSPMASPIICVLKKSGDASKPEVRLVCDFRYLNAYTQAYPFPVPDLDEVLNAVAQYKFISLFDAKSGYYQTKIRSDKTWLTGIITPSGLFEWTRTPFGMRNSGSTFLFAINEILKPVKSFTVSFVDDMCVGAMEWSEHLTNLRQYLQVMKDAGITLNLRKSELAKPEVKFVGQIVGNGTKRPDPNKIEAVRNMARPGTLRQLRSVVGMFGYHQSYIPEFASIAKPLTDLTAKRIQGSLPWTEREQKAFDTLKEKLCRATELYVPKIGQVFIIRSDASGVAVAASLSQLSEGATSVEESGSNERPVAFCSKKLSPTQRNWSTIEREAFAVIYALNRFHNIIFGAPIVVYCDHNPLSYIVDCSTRSAKLTRWSLALQEYDITFRYARAEHNGVADCLSRPGDMP